MQKSIKLLVLLISISNYIYAANNQVFQDLDNQIGIGFGYSSLNAYNPNNSGTAQTTTTNSANLHVEQLFNSNVWLTLDGSFVFNANQQNIGSAFLDTIQAYNLPASVTGKMGYSFNSSSLGLQVIPYLTTGIVLNYNGVTLPQDGFANSYYMLYGGGVRLEYAILPELSVFFDQTVGYLNDQGGSSVNLSAMDYNSALGIKYNASKHIQVGLQGNINQLYTTGQNVGFDQVGLVARNTEQTAYGGMVSVAYLFNNTGGNGSSPSFNNYYNPALARFDNSYNIGYGFATATNSYSGGNLPAINSSLGFLNVDFSHIFENNIWAKVDGSLITGMTQANTISGHVSQNTPTYLGFPGSLTADAGYAFVTPINLQVIPYLNLGVDGNINTYNAAQSTSLSYVLSHDYMYQYGIGGRVEYLIMPRWQLYFDQLVAGLHDKSIMGLEAWRFTSTLGTKFMITDTVNLGLNGFYDMISPSTTTYNPSAGINYAASQNTLGGIVSVGVNY